MEYVLPTQDEPFRAREFDLSDPVNSFVQAVKQVAARPIEFFQALPRAGGYLSPLLFSVICVTAAALVNVVLSFGWMLPFLALIPAAEQDPTATIPVLVMVVMFAGMVLATPILVAVGVFIGAGIYHLFVLMLAGPGNAGYQATFRVVAYSTVVQLVSWVPCVGFLANFYGLYLTAVGVREVHSTTTERAILIVALPFVLTLLLACGIIALALLFTLGVASTAAQ